MKFYKISEEDLRALLLRDNELTTYDVHGVNNWACCIDWHDVLSEMNGDYGTDYTELDDLEILQERAVDNRLSKFEVVKND
jgi:hypothetical protein